MKNPMYESLTGDGPDRFALRRGPDGVYLVDGRVIPVADNSAGGVDDSKPVVGIHVRDYSVVGVARGRAVWT